MEDTKHKSKGAKIIPFPKAHKRSEKNLFSGALLSIFVVLFALNAFIFSNDFFVSDGTRGLAALSEDEKEEKSKWEKGLARDLAYANYTNSDTLGLAPSLSDDLEHGFLKGAYNVVIKRSKLLEVRLKSDARDFVIVPDTSEIMERYKELFPEFTKKTSFLKTKRGLVNWTYKLEDKGKPVGRVIITLDNRGALLSLKFKKK